MSLQIHQHRQTPAQQPLAGDLTLQRGRVHEFCGPSRLMLAARIMARSQGPVIWIRPGWGTERLNAAGLQPLADPSRLILIQAPRDDGLLWAAEESLRSGAAPLVIAELLTPPALTPIRRLHLAACAAPPVISWYGSARDTVSLRCPDPGSWRIFVPLVQGNQAANSQPAVLRGESVTIAIEGEGFSVAQSGEALDPGAVGAWIRVRPANVTSPPFRARIVRPGLVAVDLGGNPGGRDLP